MASDTPLDLDTRTEEILLAASNHDLAALKPFLRVPGAASVQDSETGKTPLHVAIEACGEARSRTTNGATKEGSEESEDVEAAKKVIRELFLSGAIWNDLDLQNETPGCLAWRLGQKELYEMIVEAGVRAEMLMGIMGGYEELDDEDDEEDEEETAGEGAEAGGEGDKEDDEHADGGYGGLDITPAMILAAQKKRDVNSEDYLKSKLTFDNDKLLDSDANGVMMAWETDIMRRSVASLLPISTDDAGSGTSGLAQGKRILNIGFGMGIVDGMFAATKPAAHHIIEAHPDVLAQLAKPTSAFGPSWQSDTNVVHAGRWQDVVPSLLESGEVFDAIYFDTFGEDYSALKLFFTEYVVGLLDPEGRFGFFNGLGADRRVCYDVYTKVVELDLCDAGLDVAWEEVKTEGLGGEGEGEWDGVRRRYWTLETYRLPTCTFMG